MTRMILAALGVFLMLAVGATTALAQGLPGATVRPDANSGAPAGNNDHRDAGKAAMRERCKKNPRDCEEMKARMKERRAACRADPEKCRAEFKARMAERCRNNPAQCEKMKARMQERRAECKADPDKCRPGQDRRPDGKQ